MSTKYCKGCKCIKNLDQFFRIGTVRGDCLLCLDCRYPDGVPEIAPRRYKADDPALSFDEMLEINRAWRPTPSAAAS